MSSHKVAPPGHTTSGTWNWRRVRRWAAWAIGAPFALLLVLVLLLLLLYVAWALSNLNDATPMPVPAELVLPASRVPDERNAAYAVMALFAPEGSDPDALGREHWKKSLAWAAAPRVGGQAAPYPTGFEGSSDRFKTLNSQPWRCAAESEACVDQWLEHKVALAAQRELGRVWGMRCERLLDGAFEFEELLPPRLEVRRKALAPVSELVACERWFTTGAVLAWASGNGNEALLQLRRANKLRVNFLDGSRTLIVNVIALRVARRVESTFAAIAVRDAALAPQLADLLSPLPDLRQVAKRWIAAEASFQRNLMTDMAIEGQGQARHQDDVTSEGRAWQTRLALAVADALSLVRFSLQVERTTQATNQLWLDRIKRLDQPDMGASVVLNEPPEGRFLGFAWRNTAGQAMNDASMPLYTRYFARHADAQLHSQVVALALAIQAQRIPASEREGWTQKQNLPDTLKQRLSWSDEGRKISAKSWASGPNAGGFTPARDGIAVQWLH